MERARTIEARDNRGGIDNKRSPADPKRRDWEGERAEATNDETIGLLTTHETQISSENGPA